MVQHESEKSSRRVWQRRILTFLMVFGPGLIVMKADNDAGAASTYMQEGGTVRSAPPLTVVLLLATYYFIQ